VPGSKKKKRSEKKSSTPQRGRGEKKRDPGLAADIATDSKEKRKGPNSSGKIQKKTPLNYFQYHLRDKKTSKKKGKTKEAVGKIKEKVISNKKGRAKSSEKKGDFGTKTKKGARHNTTVI